MDHFEPAFDTLDRLAIAPLPGGFEIDHRAHLDAYDEHLDGLRRELDRSIVEVLFHGNGHPNDRAHSIRDDVRRLVEHHGVRRLDHVRDDEGRGLLHRAIAHTETGFPPEAVQAVNDRRLTALLDAGLDIDLVDSSGECGALPLLVAIDHGVHVETLLKHGANPNGTDAEYTPVLGAVARGRETVGVMHLLLLHGASIDAQDIEGDPPLLAAVTEGVVHNVAFLLDHGANPTLAMRRPTWKHALRIAGNGTDGSGVPDWYVDTFQVSREDVRECVRMVRAAAKARRNRRRLH